MTGGEGGVGGCFINCVYVIFSFPVSSMYKIYLQCRSYTDTLEFQKTERHRMTWRDRPHDPPHDRLHNGPHDQPHNWHYDRRQHDWPHGYLVICMTDPITVLMTVPMTDQIWDARAGSRSRYVLFFSTAVEVVWHDDHPAHIVLNGATFSSDLIQNRDMSESVGKSLRI